MQKFLGIFNDNEKFSKKISRYTIFLLMIIGISLLIRFYYYPSEVPLRADALYYFWYSIDIFLTGELPSNWSPSNNGWPIFVSSLFTIFGSNDILTLMQIQRFSSVLISVAMIIPVYFLCKKFVPRKFAIIGASFIAFDPRLMVNSFLGATDPLYLILIVTSLTLFLSSNKKFVYFSFVLISLATIVRGEGMVFFVALSIMFLIRYRKDKYKLFFKYIIVLGIFVLIILPVSLYRIDAIGSDEIFMRSLKHGDDLASNFVNSENSRNIVFEGTELFVKYLIWVLIPSFIIFIPLGAILIFRNRNFEKHTLIVSMVFLAIPAFYAYTVSAQDTRYLYTLFPIFSVLAVLSIEKMISKLRKSNIIVLIIISAIIISSAIFYEELKIDYEHEKEAFDIMYKISAWTKGTNILYPETAYFLTSQTIKQWPLSYSEMKFEIVTIPITDYDSLEKYVIDSKIKGLTHIMVDSYARETILNDVFVNEKDFSYLKKIYDSKEDGFNYHVKVFEIDYTLMEKLIVK